MYYWDTSAVGSFLFEEKESKAIREFNAAHKALLGYSSFLTLLETESLFQRKRKEGFIRNVSDTDFLVLTGKFFSTLRTLHSNDVIAREARRMIKDHGLRVADGIQLATALFLSYRAEKPSFQPQEIVFLSFDKKLSRAAMAEGFEVPLQSN